MKKAVLLIGCLVASGARAASFDCGRATSADERAVCAHRALNDADVRVAVKYEIVSRTLGMGSRSDARDDQRAFLASRRRCGASVGCVSRLYAAREATLEAGLDHIYRAAPF